MALLLGLAVLMPARAEGQACYPQSEPINGIYYALCDDGTAHVIVDEKHMQLAEAIIRETLEHEGRTHTVVRINFNAFKDCKELNTVRIPNSVKDIYSNAFENCTSLKSIILPNSLVTIESGTFAGSGLTSIEIPPSVNKIYHGAFGNCADLQSVTIGKEVTEIGSKYYGGAFGGCKKLSKITCHATTPPWVHDDEFRDVAPGCTLYVPAGSKAAYKAKAGWKHLNIVEMKGTK